MLYVVFTFILLMIVAVVLLKAFTVNVLTRTAPASLILIPAVSGDKQFERRVKAFHAEQLFCDGHYTSEILLVVSCSDMEDTARRLAEELDGVTVVRLQELEKYISDNYKEYRFTDS